MDIKLYYTETGTGEPLILLHGNGENSGYFVHQIEYFSKKYRVIAIDTRGHGMSPRGNAPFTIRQFAEDLYSFMNEHNIQKAHILGFSDGGNIALVFALNYQERVKSLILNGANLNSNGVRLNVQIPIFIGYKIALLFAGKNSDAEKNAEMLGLMVNEPNIKSKQLSELYVKTLVICGTKDMIKKKHTEMIYKNIKNAEIALIHGNHFIANESPLVFNKKVEEFLEKNI